MRTRRLARPALAAVVAVLAVVGVSTGTALAHDPVILEPAQATPADGPLLVDGTVSFALYGTVNGAGDTRGFRVRYAAGQTFNLSALVPNLQPEQGLPVDQYPQIAVVTPAGERIDLSPGEVSTFDEPFTKTSYRRYLEWSTTAEAGDYGVIITGVAPSRFTVSTGVKEQFGTAVENIANRDLGVAGVMQWYETAPPTTVATTTVPITPINAVDTTTAVDATATAETTTPAVIATAPPTSDSTDATAGGTEAGTDSGNDSDSGQAPVVAIVVVLLVAVVAGAVTWLARRRS
ncbi:MAG: hypothetical protein ACKPDI_09395 [Actinomycetota bacterium]